MISPRVPNWSWGRSLPQFVALAVSIAIAYCILPVKKVSVAIVIGALVYVVYSFGARKLLAKHHRRGIQAFRAGRYEEALTHYDRSISFFERHPWIDRYRAIAMMSPSTWSYREMGLMNKALAIAQNDNHEAAIAGYEAVLTDYPENEMAKQALKMVHSSATKETIGGEQAASSNH